MFDRTEHGSRDLINVAEAIQILDAAAVSPRVQRVRLLEAQGMRLAEQIVSDRDYPPFDKAVMDGYAVRADDVARPGVALRVVDTVAAGAVGQRAIGAGEAAAIMTGAPVPPGADAVVPIERTSRAGNTIDISIPVKRGSAIAVRGSDILANILVLAPGTRLGPAQIAVAASVGGAHVAVYAKPIVALLSSGDELIDIDQSPAGAQIRNSNTHMMAALLRQLGCDVRDLGIVRDDRDAIRQSMQQGILADALFITGGVSMGERDYIPALLEELGFELRIRKLRIKPGKPFIFASKPAFESIDIRPTPDDHGLRTRVSVRDQYVFGLPGNPVSAFVCTVRLAARLLSRMGGGPPGDALMEARLASPLPLNGAREFYQPALRIGSSVQPLEWNGSADIYTLAGANALIIRPEDAPPANPGDSVQLIDLSTL